MTLPWLISYLMLWAVVVMLTIVLAALARQIGLLHRRLPPMGARMSNPGPEIGEIPQEFEVPDLHGTLVRLPTDGRLRTLLLFVLPNCTTCGVLAPAVRSIARSERGRMRIVLASIGGNETENRQFVTNYRLAQLPLVRSDDLGRVYGVLLTPYALLMDEAGRLVAKGQVAHLEHLESLLNAADRRYPSVDEDLATNKSTTSRSDIGEPVARKGLANS